MVLVLQALTSEKSGFITFETRLLITVGTLAHTDLTGRMSADDLGALSLWTASKSKKQLCVKFLTLEIIDD